MKELAAPVLAQQADVRLEIRRRMVMNVTQRRSASLLLGLICTDDARHVVAAVDQRRVWAIEPGGELEAPVWGGSQFCRWRGSVGSSV